MTTRELILRGSATLVVAMLCSLVCLEEAAAQWTFDENQCSPRTEHEILALPPPAAMIMVDRSGSMRGDKWRAAKSAISAVTQDMTQPEPDDLEFGLGLFYGSTAQVRREASPNAHSPIMSILNNESPNGGTPMANAIHTMRNSNTVQGNIPFTSTPIPIGNYSNGIDQTIPDSCSWRTSRIYVPGSASFDSVEMNLTLYERRRRRRCILWGAFCWWDTDTYNDANDFTIELRHDGVTKRISNSGQGGASTFSGRTINGFEHTSMQGWWDLRIRDCVSGNDGRLEGWGLRFVQDPPQYTGDRASAGILVTDGVPSYSRSGPVAAACAHRNEAPLYVVGLGSGTDREYNDVLAAAGGTGSCSNGDPCDNPNNWQVYDGQCDGSFQTSNANSLNAALSQIANEISCTFPLEVLGGGSVPPSNQGCPNYDCVKVVLDSGIGRIRHIDSPTSSIGPKGWRWASNSDRKNVKLSSTYCLSLIHI